MIKLPIKSKLSFKQFTAGILSIQFHGWKHKETQINNITTMNNICLCLCIQLTNPLPPN